MLARLLAARGAVVPADLLIADVFPGEAPAPALARLQRCVTALRRVLEAHTLVSVPPGYALRPGTLDAEEFERLVRTAGAVPDIDRALELWRGTPYEDVADRPWAAAEIGRLTELRLRAREQRLGLLLAQGDAGCAVPELRELTARHPYRERLWCLLAVALHRLGRSADALFTVRLAADVIGDELGVEPGHDLRRLEAELAADPPRANEPVLCVELPPAVRRVEPRDPLVGRDALLAELTERACQQGAPGPIVIAGDQGSGRTRLLDALADTLGDRGWTILHTSCLPDAPAFDPWSRLLLREAALQPPPAVLRLLTHTTPRADPSGPHRDVLDEPDNAPERPDDDRHPLFTAVGGHLAALAAEHPLAILIDDVHHADQATMDLIAHISRAEPFARTAGDRPASGSVPGGGPVADWAAVRGRPVVIVSASGFCGLGGVRVPAAALDADEIETMAMAIGLPIGRRTAEEIVDATGGNPYFARAILPRVSRAPDELQAVRAESGGGLLPAVRRGLARLPAPVRSVLETAAVIGAAVEAGLVAEVGGHSAQDVEEAFDLGVLLGILVTEPGIGLRFAHEPVRTILRDDLAEAARSRLHEAALRALLTRPGVSAERLAVHALAAFDGEATAVRWAVAAAEEAAHRQAFHSAARWWSKAADGCGGTAREQAELWLGQIGAEAGAGEPGAARRTRARALERVESDPAVRGDPVLGARLLTSLDGPAVWTRLPYRETEHALVKRLEHTLAALPYGDSPLRCRMYSNLARELSGIASADRCESLAYEAVEMARRLGRPRALAPVLQDRLQSAAQAGDLLGAERLACELIEVADSGGLLAYGLAARLALLPVYAEGYDLVSADRRSAECGALLDRVVLPGADLLHLLWRSTRAMLSGRPDDVRSAATALPRPAEPQVFGDIVGVHTMLAAAHRDAGARPTLDETALADLRRRLTPRAATPPADALDPGTEQHLPDGGTDGWSWLSLACLRAQAHIDAGDAASGERAITALLPHAGRLSTGHGLLPAGPVGYHLGRLALLCRRDTEARSFLKDALDRCARAGLTGWEDRIRMVLGSI
ncbi:BTAD domain-containing putative transcriptional regulator [Spongiactinospora sp. TRM90649]|uniref:BTAD domain-containing putative transcriptional regulator n=1 Tax=Spongiactinospora sp. TRM90649 TaxID=3031114 RepID=UPI0023F94A27|nr:BTAD domain-containing putative transcriptional regulator [Spongiactinospora sp. TRM90649]MDF5752776.1 BTAD domain-containing putative transcriptional regulator [Spongiactinospora sp. TRM90649]